MTEAPLWTATEPALAVSVTSPSETSGPVTMVPVPLVTASVPPFRMVDAPRKTLPPLRKPVSRVPENWIEPRLLLPMSVRLTSLEPMPPITVMFLPPKSSAANWPRFAVSPAVGVRFGLPVRKVIGPVMLFNPVNETAAGVTGPLPE